MPFVLDAAAKSDGGEPGADAEAVSSAETLGADQSQQ